MSERYEKINELAEKLARHLRSTGAAACKIPVTVDDMEYIVMAGTQRETLAYDREYLEIPPDDLPPDGYALVCIPSKKKSSWAVIVVNTAESLPLAKGIFWEKSDAVKFAETLNIGR